MGGGTQFEKRKRKIELNSSSCRTIQESRPLLEGVTQINELQEFCGNSTCKCEFEIITDAYCASTYTVLLSIAIVSLIC